MAQPSTVAAFARQSGFQHSPSTSRWPTSKAVTILPPRWSTSSVSTRVLDIQQSHGLRSGAAHLLLEDAADKLEAMLKNTPKASSLGVFGLGSQQELIEANVHTLLNYAEAELQDGTEKEKIADRLAVVNRYLASLPADVARERQTIFMRSRATFIEASNCFNEDGDDTSHDAGSCSSTWSEQLEKTHKELGSFGTTEEKYLRAQIKALRGRMIYYDTENPEAAKNELEQALRLFEDVTANTRTRDPKRYERYAREIYSQLEFIGYIQFEACRIKEAKDILSAASRRLESLPPETRKAYGLRNEYFKILMQLGEVLGEEGNNSEALNKLTKAFDTLSELISLDPDNERSTGVQARELQRIVDGIIKASQARKIRADTERLEELKSKICQLTSDCKPPAVESRRAICTAAPP